MPVPRPCPPLYAACLRRMRGSPASIALRCALFHCVLLDAAASSSNATASNGTADPANGAPPPSTTATTPQPSSTHTESNATNCEFGTTSGLELGGRAVFCVFMAPTSTTSGSANGSPKKMTFSIKVDEYASLTLAGADGLTESAAEDGADVYSWVAAAGAGSAHPLDCTHGGEEHRKHRVTCPQLYRTREKIVPFVSLVINLSSGNVKSMVFDNLCPSCSTANCLPSRAGLDENYAPVGEPRESSKTCAQDEAELQLQQPQDFKIFVTWAGTDANGRNCKSSAFRFSRFAGATLSDMWTFTQDSYHSSFG